MEKIEFSWSELSTLRVIVKSALAEDEKMYETVKNSKDIPQGIIKLFENGIVEKKDLLKKLESIKD